jgi:hypothetical protein
VAAVFHRVARQLHECLLERSLHTGQLVQGDAGAAGQIADLLDRRMVHDQRVVDAGHRHALSLQQIGQGR